jgi:WD40 repeat protein
MYEIKQTAPIYAISFTKGSDQLIIAQQFGAVAVYDTENGVLLRTLPAEDGSTSSTILVRPVGNEILTVSSDGAVRMWDAALESCRLSRLNTIIQSVCVAPLEDLAALAVTGGALLILDLGTLESRMTTMRNMLRGVTNLQLNTAGTRILARVFRGEYNTRVYDVNSAALIFEFHSNCVALFSLDNTYIFGSSACGQLSCWEVDSGAEATSPFITHDISLRSQYISMFEIASSMVLM